jgi:molybdopterin adenylyltransferase
MNNKGRVVSVNISEKIGTPKAPADSIRIDRLGVRLDAHRGTQRQVSLLSEESIKAFGDKFKRTIGFGEFAENITSSGIDLGRVNILDTFTIGKTVLSVTQIGKECHGDTCAIFREVGKCIMPKEGIFCRVLRGGTIKSGDSIEHIRRSVKVKVITLSDRASSGIYDDASGPAIRESLSLFFEKLGWDAMFQNTIIPDDKRSLAREIKKAISDGTRLIVTTGGTGITKRDITPDVVKPMLTKEIPGIMESIRVKYGRDFPNAVLSRSVCGIIGSTLIYTLPGSPRAVHEYCDEIVKTLEHCIIMTMNIAHDAHI